MANNNMNTSDVIRDTVNNAVGSVVSAMEPQLNDLATRVVNQAMDRSVGLAQSAYQRVQRQPWYLVGFAAVLLIGAAVLIGFQSRDQVTRANA